MNIKPLAGYLLIEPKEAETKTASGIILPDSATEKPQQGTVVAVGDDIVTDNGTRVKSPVAKGDVVIYKKWGGDELKMDGKEMKIVKFDDLMALVEEAPKKK